MQDPWWTTCFSRCGRTRAPPPPPSPPPPLLPLPPSPPSPPNASRSRSVLFHLLATSTILYSPTAIAIFAGAAFLLLACISQIWREIFKKEFLLPLAAACPFFWWTCYVVPSLYFQPAQGKVLQNVLVQEVVEVVKTALASQYWTIFLSCRSCFSVHAQFYSQIWRDLFKREFLLMLLTVVHSDSLYFQPA